MDQALPLKTNEKLIRAICTLSYEDIMYALDSTTSERALRSTISRLPGNNIRFSMVMRNEQRERCVTVLAQKDPDARLIDVSLNFHPPGDMKCSEQPKSVVAFSIRYNESDSYVLNVLVILGNIKHNWNSVRTSTLRGALEIICGWKESDIPPDLSKAFSDFYELSNHTSPIVM